MTPLAEKTQWHVGVDGLVLADFEGGETLLGFKYGGYIDTDSALSSGKYMCIFFEWICAFKYGASCRKPAAAPNSVLVFQKY
jgi:hypothetical protein